MLPRHIFQKIWFRLRYEHRIMPYLRKYWWQILGAHVGRGTTLPVLEMTWPHQVQIGDKCNLKRDIRFKFDGVWKPGPSIVVENHVFIGEGCEFNIRKHIQVQSDSLIASGCKFIDHDHSTVLAAGPMNNQPCLEAPIIIEENVWLGVNVIVLKGVTIGTGAVVGAGAVVTKSIPANEVWAGIPARKIGERR